MEDETRPVVVLMQSVHGTTVLGIYDGLLVVGGMLIHHDYQCYDNMTNFGRSLAFFCLDVSIVLLHPLALLQ